MREHDVEHIKGWTVALMWLTTALAIYFFSLIWPSLNAWLRTEQHLSGWMQFFGAILAIFGAYYLGERQAKAARALVSEQQLVEGLRLLQTVHNILDHTRYTLRVFREAWELHGNVQQTIAECKRMKSVIEGIDLVKCNAPALSTYLLQIPQLLAEAIEHQLFVGQHYEAVLLAGRDEPGERDRIFTRQMKQTKAIENFIQLATQQADAEE